MPITRRRRWTLLVIVGAGLLLITLDNSVLYTALPTLTTDLGATGTQSLWIINAYPVVVAGLLLGSGTLGDRIGHRRMFVIGLVIFGVASLIAAFSPNAAILIAARAILGVGAATMMPATLALIRTTFEIERERNVAIAVWGSLSVVGAALGPIVGGTLLQFFWWGSVFLINVPVVIVALIAMVLIAPPNDPDLSKRWDLISSIQVMVGLVALVFAIKELGHLPPNWAILIPALIVTIAGFSLFVRRQRRMPVPLLDFAIFKNPAFTAGTLAATIAMFASAGIQLASTQRFQLVEGFTPLQSGLLVAAVAVGSLPTALVGGATLHRTGPLPLIAGGLGLSGLGVIITIIGVEHGFGLIVLGLLLTGAGLGAAMSVASSAIVGNVPKRQAGMAASVEEVSYEFGSLTAVAILGSLLAFVYTAAVSLPAGAPRVARESITDALEVTPHNPALVTAASNAFDTAYLAALIVVAAVLVVGAVATGILLRHHGPASASRSRSSH